MPLLQFVLGPKDITEDDHDIGVLTRGLCFRWGKANDHTSNFLIGDDFPNPKAFVPKEAKFSFPTESGKETVQNRQM